MTNAGSNYGADRNPQSSGRLSFNNLKIVQKFFVGFGVLVVLSGGVAAFTYERINYLQERSEWKDHTYAVLDVLGSLLLTMVNQETGLRGYLVSADRDFLEPFDSGKRDFKDTFSRIKTLTADNPAQQRRLDDLLALATTWQTDVAARQIELMANPASRDQARALEAGGAGKASMDGFREKLTEIADIERALLSTRNGELQSARTLTRTVAIGGGVGSVVISVLLALMLTRSIAAPITRLTEAMRRLASGDLSAEVDASGRVDEVGAMARAVEIFKTNALEMQRMQAGRAADEQRARAERAQQTTQITSTFERSVGSIVTSVSTSATDMEATAKSLSSTAARTSARSIAVAAASDQVSASVQTIASAAEELTSSITEISRQVSQSARVTAEAVTEATRTNAEVASLADAAQRIGAIVSLISDIASQTNLLALNATIEAARAGPAGSGFAVVAAEVKNLAMQTAKATDDITGQINGIQQATQGSVVAIKSIHQTVSRINEIASAIASAVEQQGAATSEIARNAQDASVHTREVATSIESVSQAANETGTAADHMLASAGKLAQEGSRLRAEVGGFLDVVRAA